MLKNDRIVKKLLRYSHTSIIEINKDCQILTQSKYHVNQLTVHNRFECVFPGCRIVI